VLARLRPAPSATPQRLCTGLGSSSENLHEMQPVIHLAPSLVPPVEGTAGLLRRLRWIDAGPGAKSQSAKMVQRPVRPGGVPEKAAGISKLATRP
jgi:hypothetical protein